MTGPTVAAVDIGTNSVRLLIARPAADGTLEVLARPMTITRLGQGVDGSGRLAPDAIARTAGALAGFAERWAAVGVDAVSVCATSAARDATNAEALHAAVTAATGVRLRILSGDEEAAIAFRGATSGLPPEVGRVCIVDIGGGSTELVVGGAADDGLRATSRQLGSVRLTERVLRDDPATPAQIAAATALIDRELDAAAMLVSPGDAEHLVAVAGTATTLAALDLGLAAYDHDAVHRHTIPAAALRRQAERLLSATTAEKRALGAMAPGRADVIAAGALILSRTVDHLGFHDVLVSAADILDGLALELLDTPDSGASHG